MPQVREVSEASVRGTEIHRFLALLPSIGVARALERVAPEYRSECEAIGSPLDEMGGEWVTEQPLAWDVVKAQGRLLAPGRDYSIHTTEIPGTADVVGVSDDKVWILDWKTGYSEITRAGENPQLLLYALALCSVFHKHKARLMIVWPREDSIVKDIADVDALDLDLFANRVSDAMKRVEISKSKDAPDVSMGPWCRYCASRVYCPGRVGVIRALATNGPEAILRRPIAELDQELVVSAYRSYVYLRSFVEDIGEAFKRYAASNPIELGEGKVYGLGPGKRSVEGDIAYEVLKERMGEAFARECCEAKTSMSAIRSALRAVVEPKQVSKKLNELLDEINKRGGMKIRREVREFKRGES